ncbi:MAG: hypothetical protein JO033_12265, partial [Acidobacteriaceae bacterium]|nr:hypothetical protein [Acidobacteriaceae bacterium]
MNNSGMCLSGKLCPVTVAFALALVLGVPASANTISFAQTIFNTNFVTSDIGLRNVGAGTLNVSGITGTVTDSLLFWHGPTNSTDPNANANVNFNGTAITGTNIGFSQDNFWKSLNSQAYRANVTSLVTGNGSYALSNFQKTDAQVNGAALFTFYNSGLTTGKRDVVLFEGNDSNFASKYDAAGWNFTLSGIDYTTGNAFLTLYVSDGQNFGPHDDGTLRVNGVAIASGGIFQGSAPKAPGAGVSNGSLTDVETFEITSLLSPGMNSLHVTLDAGFKDAISAVVAA